MNSLSSWLCVVTHLFSEICEVPQNLQYPLGNFCVPRAGTRTTPSLHSVSCGGSLSTIWQACSDFPKTNVKILRGLCGPKVKSRSRSHRTFSWKKKKKRLQCCGFFLFFFSGSESSWHASSCFSSYFGSSRNDTQPLHNHGALSTGPWYIYWEIFNK